MIASWWDPPGWRWRPKGIDYPFALRRRHFDRCWQAGVKLVEDCPPRPRTSSQVARPQDLDLFSSSILLCACLEVTVTSLHPPRPSRFVAVLSKTHRFSSLAARAQSL